MTRDKHRLWGREIAVDHMQVGATDAAGHHGDPDLAMPRLGHWYVLEAQARADGAVEDHCSHRSLHRIPLQRLPYEDPLSVTVDWCHGSEQRKILVFR
jgi:hypothetical protein